MADSVRNCRKVNEANGILLQLQPKQHKQSCSSTVVITASRAQKVISKLRFHSQDTRYFTDVTQHRETISSALTPSTLGAAEAMSSKSYANLRAYRRPVYQPLHRFATSDFISVVDMDTMSTADN